MADLNKQSCLDQRGKEWVPGHSRAGDCGVKDPRKREVLRDMLEDDINIVQSMSRQDDPLVQPSTAECVRDSFERVSGYCRDGRNRTLTQPDSYDTGDAGTSGTIESETSQTEVSDWLQDRDW